jgi:hypothetical protein
MTPMDFMESKHDVVCDAPFPQVLLPSLLPSFLLTSLFLLVVPMMLLTSLFLLVVPMM